MTVSMLSWIRRLWRRFRKAPARSVVLYTRHGCHLCEEACSVLAKEQATFRFTLKTIDVDSDPDLEARYGQCVPVVTIDGQVRFRGQVNRVLLRRLLMSG